MKMPRVKTWARLVLCYWLMVSVVVFLEMRYMDQGWAGLPGVLLTLPLSTLVVAGYLLARYAAEFHGYDIHVTEYHAEYGYLVCAFLNAFIFYPFYLWWRRRKGGKGFDPPPPPPDIGMRPTPRHAASHDS